MDKPTEIEEREAPHGEKMIELRVRFWTNLASEKGHVIPESTPTRRASSAWRRTRRMGSGSNATRALLSVPQ